MKKSDVDLANVIARGVSKALKETLVTLATKTEPDEDIVAHARLIKDYCESRDCNNCELCEINGKCIVNDIPHCWKI